MNSGSRVLHWDTPAPPHTQRLHLSTRVGDSMHGIDLCSRRPAGADQVAALDYNMQTVEAVDGLGERTVIPVSGHWTSIGRNGYDSCHLESGGLRRLTRAERRMTYQQWVDRHEGTLASLQDLRRRNGDFPMTWEQSVQYAAGKGVVLTPELKSQGFTLDLVAEDMVRVCREFDYPLWAMALLSMKFADLKCAAIENAGGSFALIFGRFRPQAGGANQVAGWVVKPSQIWGPVIARRWIR